MRTIILFAALFLSFPAYAQIGDIPDSAWRELADDLGKLNAQVMEQVYTRDLKSLDESHGGSSPSLGTTFKEEWWITMPFASNHKSDKPYEENNWGLGIEYRLTDVWSLSAVTYRNSFSRTSTCLGGGYAPQQLRLTIHSVQIRLSMLAALCSGYAEHLVFIPAPVLGIEIDRAWGLDILLTDEVKGFTMKYRF